jgi:hypothetical protein
MSGTAVSLCLQIPADNHDMILTLGSEFNASYHSLIPTVIKNISFEMIHTFRAPAAANRMIESQLNKQDISMLIIND